MLLEKWREENIHLELKSCTRKKPTWIEIAAHLRAVGYEDRDDVSCKTRIHTLISVCRTYKDECAKTGNARRKKNPVFFDEMDELFVSFCRALLSALVVRCELDDHMTMFN